MYFSRFQTFTQWKGRENAWHTLCHHGLPTSGWTDHNQVVSSGRGYFQCAFYTFLSFHISKIVWKATLVFIEFLPCIDDARLQIAFIIEKFDDLFDIFYAIYFQVVYYSSFPRIFCLGSMKPSKPCSRALIAMERAPLTGWKASIQAKFSDNKITWKFFFRYDLGSGQYSDC